MPTNTFDPARVRAEFPALDLGVAYFDGPGGSQVPSSVAAAVAGALTAGLANRGSVTDAERRADELVTGARAAVADLLGADPRGVVFGRSMTQLTFDFARTLSREWGPGDEVVVTRLDHDANIRPWVLAAERTGATVRWLDFDPETAELDDLETVLSTRTRLVAVTAASNLLGTRPDVRAIADTATRWTPWCTSTACTSLRTPPSTWPRSAPTSWVARRTSSSGRTWACSPPARRCSSA